MKRPRCDIWFLASVIEFYKDEKHMTGQDTFNYLYRTGAAEYIIKCHEGLHMTSPEYIIDSVDEFIRTHGNDVVA
jgi:hypothetical protein